MYVPASRANCTTTSASSWSCWLNLSRLTGMIEGRAESLAGEAARCADSIATSVHDLPHRLYPARPLRLVGLVAALEGLLADLSLRSARATFSHRTSRQPSRRILTLCLFRIAQEALQNALNTVKLSMCPCT